MVEVASPVPTTAGTPSSRAMIAAWQVRPPRLVTMAAAVFITGSQSGVVESAMRTSPVGTPKGAPAVDDSGSPRRDLLSYGSALNHDFAAAVEHVGLEQ